MAVENIKRQRLFNYLSKSFRPICINHRQRAPKKQMKKTSTIRQTGGCNMPHLRKLAVGYESELSADKREMSLKRSLPSQSASSAPLQSF
ncbi:unnamed protein product [Ceratitis capitata]|uniref:(Mediterranean fruit fly) hypothetical protein n=1 Tax=Ceratitis capitata TaxID=7213 RepID=A0A811UHC0_CERCA|nr:unnamed protein product [Ceratitis capitata]